jgi:hypothetical protein
MDYYLDTAYPMERTGVGPGRIRVATYGDGATGVRGDGSDHFLSDLHNEFALAYAASGDERYAPFVAMSRNYQPNLWDRCPLPQGELRFPPAPSEVWPTFGIAMLRSDESPGYWTNPNAIAVLQMMTKGYGHDHRDKFGITLFGANRLLYPDFLGIQYERIAMGWTNTPACHNTMMVDEQDSANAPPAIRSEFAAEAKFLATSATGVFEGVAQTRALVLTGEYLLDLFKASSKVPHTYDYVLNSLGMPRPVQPAPLPDATAVSPRYWALDFVVKDEPGNTRSREALGPEWYQHEAKVRVTMAPERDTQVCCGIWGPGKFAERAKAIHGARDVQSRWGDRPPQLGILVARRDGRRSTVFAAAHEPYANASVPKIRAITRLAETEEAIVVRVDGEGFTDYAAVAWGTDKQSPLRVLAAAADAKQVFAFRNYAYLRVALSGDLVARGGWSGFSIPQGRGRLLLNGKEQPVSAAAGYLMYGELPKPQAIVADPESPFRLALAPTLARTPRPGQTQVRIALTNTLKQPVTGRLEFDLPAGISAGSQPPVFGPVPLGETVAIPVTLFAGEQAAEGRSTIPFRFHYRVADGSAEVRTQYLPLPTVVGSSVRADHTRGEIVVDTAGYTARLDSRSMTTMYLADPDGTVRLSGTPLFTFTGEEGKPVLWEGCIASVWLSPRSVTTALDGSCRYTTQFLADRISLPYADRTYTSIKEAHFTIPGNWISPSGAPRWKQIIAVDDQGKECDLQPGQEAKVAAAELAFPQSAWNIAIAFNPPRKVAFDGLKVRFVIPIRQPVAWALGFCKPGTLDQWRRIRTDRDSNQ